MDGSVSASAPFDLKAFRTESQSLFERMRDAPSLKNELAGVTGIHVCNVRHDGAIVHMDEAIGTLARERAEELRKTANARRQGLVDRPAHRLGSQSGEGGAVRANYRIYACAGFPNAELDEFYAVLLAVRTRFLARDEADRLMEAARNRYWIRLSSRGMRQVLEL